MGDFPDLWVGFDGVGAGGVYLVFMASGALPEADADSWLGEYPVAVCCDSVASRLHWNCRRNCLVLNYVRSDCW